MTAYPALAKAAGPGRLTPYFQPIMRLADGAFVGLEALARWRRDDGTVAEAASFLPKGSWTDEFAEVGRAVAADAIRQFAHWRKDKAEPISLAVNIIGDDLMSGAALRLAAEASLLGLPQGALVMELTEHHALADIRRAGDALTSLRMRGVRIALDDFGTGHSSLAWLARLPIDAIKIDQSFVAGINELGAERTIVGALITMARELGLETIAEGIETESQRSALDARGCAFGQGRLYAMPLPAEEAFKLG
ncbi:MAG: EAL domain-containing protein [Hyphomonadaceae bacterium]